MVRYERDEYVDLDRYEYYLKRNGCYVLYDRDMLDRYRKGLQNRSGVYELMAADRMRHHSGGRYLVMTKDGIIQYLANSEHCPWHYFNNRHTKSESLDMKKCLLPLYENGYAQEFLEYYMQYRSLSNKSNKLKKIIGQCNSGEAKSHDGVTLSRIPFNVKRNPNYRYNYSDYDIIAQIPKDTASCIGIDDGYVLAWGDFAQSDFRIAYNLFMRSEENDAVMMRYSDRYEGLARIVSSKLGRPFDSKEFAESRSLYKKLTLATVYGTASTVIKSESAFISMFNQFLDKCPRYVEYRDRLHAAYQLGLPIVVESYFGNTEVSPILPNEQSTVNRALNAPIQKGTSEIVIITVCKILEKFYSLGYGEDDISLYFVRHDEPIFKMREGVLKDSWVFQEFASILVGGWTPLEMSFTFGYWYNRPDERLVGMYRESCKANRGRVTKISPKIEIENFYPVKKIMQLITYCIKLETESIIAFYDEKRHKVHYSIAETTDDEGIWSVIVEQTRGIRSDGEYCGIVVQNNYKDHEEYSNGIFLRYKCSSGTEYYKVSSLTKYAVCRYCKANGTESPVDPPLESMSEFVTSVGVLEEMQ